MSPYRGPPQVNVCDEDLVRIRALASEPLRDGKSVLRRLAERSRRIVRLNYVARFLTRHDDARHALRMFSAEEKEGGGIHPLCAALAEAVLKTAVECLLDARPQAGQDTRAGRRISGGGVHDLVKQFFRKETERRYALGAITYDIAGYLPSPPLKRLHRHKVTGICRVIRDRTEIKIP